MTFPHILGKPFSQWQASGAELALQIGLRLFRLISGETDWGNILAAADKVPVCEVLIKLNNVTCKTAQQTHPFLTTFSHVTCKLGVFA